MLREITPDLAREWVGRTRPGNILKRKKVEKYKALMLSGRWVKGGMPVKVRDGYLIDGHHRLTAIAETGLTVKMNFINYDDK